MKIVVKLSSQLTVKSVWPYAKIIAEAMDCGNRFVVVSGGAVKRGLKLRGLENPTVLQQQAAAGLGQIGMMGGWLKSALQGHYQVAQLQYTHRDLEDPNCNADQVIAEYFEWGDVLPIVNANDVAIDEETRLTAQVSENSALASLLARKIGADKLIMLGLREGIYTDDPETCPDACLISEVTDLSDDFVNRFSDKATEGSFGGAKTNVASCVLAARAGIPVTVASGLEPNNLRRILSGEKIGTFFRPA